MLITTTPRKHCYNCPFTLPFVSLFLSVTVVNYVNICFLRWTRSFAPGSIIKYFLHPSISFHPFIFHRRRTILSFLLTVQCTIKNEREYICCSRAGKSEIIENHSQKYLSRITSDCSITKLLLSTRKIH